MGVKIYWIIVAAVILLGLLMPQEGYRKKDYIIVMAVLHSFVCGFRYKYLVGDLIKYSNGYYAYNENPELTWFHERVFNGGRNAGFEWCKRAMSLLTAGDFQMFLIVLAVIAEVGLAILIYKYSPKPWLSYLVWNCLGFYVTYDFCAIKQGLAMSILVFALIALYENKTVASLILALLAGFVHMPALVFLPMFWLVRQKMNRRMVYLYIIAIVIIYIFRNNIVVFLQDIYYAGNDEVSFTLGTEMVGGRYFVILLIAFTGALLRGFDDNRFAGLFNVMLAASVFQMFSIYDNVFTRLADYYLQFSVLYIPMIFYPTESRETGNDRNSYPILFFDQKSIKLLVVLLTLVLLWWYHRTMLGASISNEVDNYLNYRFMWDVVN